MLTLSLRGTQALPVNPAQTEALHGRALLLVDAPRDFAPPPLPPCTIFRATTRQPAGRPALMPASSPP
eukprot:CAMPEP_0172201376 /NCGR_PEP_ID=MMETSP1050-20130122/29957_1 /TAXON_ID=233186 /ORGANISM="Cryptomonas curvata, Strain CCAP979/52" /LENGTH=67 /DNA_ID=CAMNT_0012878999 /DNA_START=237 /DNA_END=440 /DNA_ORIENTATION=+